MGSISIILRRAPYGTVDASEAVRHSLGAVTEDMSAKLILLDGGVTAATKGQDTGTTKYLNVGAGILDCIDMGAEVHVDRMSMEEACLDAGDLIEGIRISDRTEIADMIRNSDTTLIF